MIVNLYIRRQLDVSIKAIKNVFNFLQTGCKDNLKEWALKHSTIIIGVGIGIAVLEVRRLFLFYLG